MPRIPPRRLEHPASIGWAERLQDPERRPGRSCGTSALTHAALRERRLGLYAEPIVDLSTHAVVAHELLLAISPSSERSSRSSDRAFQGPPAAADPDLWVVGQAAQVAAAGREAHISVCASSLRASQFPRLVGRALRRAGGDPRNVTLAIAEDVLARDQTFAFSFAFHAARLGVRLAVNDFGLRFYADGQLDALQVQLDALQVEDVKIDSWLVARVADHAPSAATVARIVELARAKGRRTIALDPPRPDTLDALRDLGVDCAQAFDLAQPSSAQA